ncbi:MAG TPA: glycoside hydrolase family 3 C-terminal domain-containing protein, partial [bacterium]|nr:glycoside hydrolase family 3 C-terminal domain-containing protein [bacterium]
SCTLVWQSAEGHLSMGIAHAAELAAKSEVAVVFVGDCISTCGEIRDRAFLDLSGGQDELLRAVYATGTPTVLVHIGGRPLTMEWAFDHVAAALTAWYPGEEGGNAIADVLFGDCTPSGKLPMTWPAYVGQLPLTYDEPMGGRGGHRYIFNSSEPRFVFGYGLSYTTFAYSNLRVPQTVPYGANVPVSVDVTNTGTREGTEVVQVYVRDVLATVKRPKRQLKSFAKVTLKPGETKTVSFELKPESLALWDQQMERVVEPGDFLVMIGGSSKTDLEAGFTVQTP